MNEKPPLVAYLGFCQASMMKFFVKKVNNSMQLNNFAYNIHHECFRRSNKANGNVGLSTIPNSLNTNPTKWSNTLKQFIGFCREIV